MSMSAKIRRDFEKYYCCALISIYGTKFNTILLILDYFLLSVK